MADRNAEKRTNRVLNHLSSNKTEDPIIIMLLGAPGAGKGTYGKIISAEFNLPTISTGDLVRAEIASGSELGKTIKTLATSGKLVADDIIIKLLIARVQMDDCKHGYILDGFPRNLVQAKALENACQISVVLNIQMLEKALLLTTTGRRSCRDCGEGYNVSIIDFGEVKLPPLKPKREGICDKCNGQLIRRADDYEEVVKQRLVVYHEQTAPLVKFYGDKGVVVTHNVKRGKHDGPEVIRALRNFLSNKTSV